MYFATEWSQKGVVGLFVTIKFIPLALVVYDREVLQSFFDEDKAVAAVFISWVFRWYYMDMRVSQARWLVIKVRKV